jgi:hypothetical protein
MQFLVALQATTLPHDDVACVSERGLEDSPEIRHERVRSIENIKEYREHTLENLLHVHWPTF